MDKLFVGVPGPWASNFSESADPFTSKIGGVPDWPSSADKLLLGLLECGACGSSLSLVSQVYAPVNTTGMKIEERTIYVFGCAKPACGHTHLSWRALRLQKLHDVSAQDASSEAHDPKANICDHAISFLDDEDIGDISLEELSNAFKDLATSASHFSEENAKKQHKTIKTSVKDSLLNLQPQAMPSSAPVLPCFYLHIQEEPSVMVTRSKLLPLHESQISLLDHDTETWDKEDYEYDKALSADRTYLKYKKLIDRCPDQCFRYQYGGKPLLATKTVNDRSPCQLCGARRHYEMQLMPPLVYFLHEGAVEDPKYSMDNWNWMTVIVYTCSQNCTSIWNEEDNTNHLWTVAVEEIELQLEEKLSIFSPLIATEPSVSV